MALHRLGLLTGGGDCPGLNALIRAVVKASVFDHGVEVIGIRNGFSGLLEENIMELPPGTTSGILPLGGTILGTSNRGNPFRVPVRDGDGVVTYEDRSGQVIGTIEKLGIDTLVCAGGDGTLSIAHALGELGVPVIGVPKTIDNDLGATDRTFGYDSAMAAVTAAVDRLHSTAEAHHRVMIVETMGRDAGWLALGGGLAGGADIILIPEIAYRMKALEHAIEHRASLGMGFSIVAIAEGAAPAGGGVVVSEVDPDRDEPVRLGGVGYRLAERIRERTGEECRVVVLGHLQRGGGPTAFDRNLATLFGVRAVELAVGGRPGRMAALKGGRVVDVPLAEAVARRRLVPPDDPLLIAARAVGTALGDEVVI